VDEEVHEVVMFSGCVVSRYVLAGVLNSLVNIELLFHEFLVRYVYGVVDRFCLHLLEIVVIVIFGVILHLVRVCCGTFVVVINLSFINLMFFLAATKDNRLRKEHRWEAKNHYEHHAHHDGALRLVSANDRVLHVFGSLLTHLDAHNDHRRDDRRSMRSIPLTPVGEPLENDQQVHKAEQAHHHQHHWDEFEEEIDPIFVVDSICTTHRDTYAHVEYSQND
jgi:hypothetical protein